MGSGEFYYKPMVEYIDWKESVEFHPTDLLERKEVHLPSALEVSKADISCLSSGRPRFVQFLTKYKAKQTQEANKQTARAKHEFARMSRKSETIPRKQTSVMIRDQYISSVSTMYQDQLKMEMTREEEEKRKNFEANNSHGYVRYAFSVNA